ncbi:MAG: hypothetical protein QGI21_04500 [Candidatus Poseidoniaceae archaeon]|jgi:hypothetical protein|nr:hypothetical protein [Candidatus Poseidoniaceae archaeon]
MSATTEGEERGLMSMITEPTRVIANWYLGVGLWGMLLAILNILGLVDRFHRVSWGGLLTFEMTNSALGSKEDAPTFVAGDLVFMLMCGILIYFGLRTLMGENTFGEWFQSILKSDSWTDIVGSEEGGWSAVIGAWLLLIGFGFYIYRGIVHMNWIDAGSYSVAIVLIATGFILRSLSTIDDQE